MNLDIIIPSHDEMDVMTLNELKDWQKKIAPYYENRFEMSFEDSMKARKFIHFIMMIANIEKGVHRWNRIGYIKGKNAN